jgi:hypothetical protein
MSINEMLMAAAGSGGGDKLYVDDCFATHLYTGNGSTQTITNGIDLAGEGGLVWIKRRDSAVNHYLATTVGGTSNYLNSNTTSDYETGVTTRITSFNADGFSLGSAGSVNNNGSTFASWTFREQAKFFDVVTYTGDGNASKTISHNLGSTPGMVIVKKTSATSNWIVWAKVSGTDKNLRLNTTDAATSDNWIYSVTSTQFVAAYDFGSGAADSMNDSGATYVAYLFAHDAGGFGAAGTDNVISCGSFTGDSTITLGYEPQYVMFKRTDSTGNWRVLDNMRGMPVIANSTGSQQVLFPNTSGAESTDGVASPTATGFQTFLGGGTYIYMAIRRPMKPPTSGTEVFVTDAAGANASANGEVFSSTFPVDWHFRKERSSSGNGWFSNSRLIPGSSLRLESSNAESTLAYVDKYDRMSGIATTTGFNYTDWAGWLFKRATGFFDIVAYTGGNSTNTRVSHNLGVAPELIIVKPRSASGSWGVYVASEGRSKYMLLNNTIASTSFTNAWGTADPTITDFGINDSGSGFSYGTATMVAYLFATVAGVSKVGSYTGNGTSQTINCGFSAGARFVLIKRTDSTGDWYVYDTARGIVSGNDPQLKLNTTGAEATGYDAVDPDNSGFIVNNDATNFPINVNNATYIFLAIA